MFQKDTSYHKCGAMPKKESKCCQMNPEAVLLSRVSSVVESLPPAQMLLMMLEWFSPLHMDMGCVQWNPVTSLHANTCSIQKKHCNTAARLVVPLCHANHTCRSISSE